MTIWARLRYSQPSAQTSNTDDFAQPRASPWSARLASAISAVLSPPLLAAAMMVVAVSATKSAAALLWASMGLLLSVIAPVGYLLWLHHRGLVSDLDVKRREERFRPLTVTVLAQGLHAALLWFGGAPVLLSGLAIAIFLQTTLTLMITLHWKISMHGVAIAAFTTLLLYLMGPRAAPLLAAVPLVAWSRVRLRRHTPGQTIAGAALGGAVTWSMFLWMAMA